MAERYRSLHYTIPRAIDRVRRRQTQRRSCGGKQPELSGREQHHDFPPRCRCGDGVRRPRSQRAHFPRLRSGWQDLSRWLGREVRYAILRAQTIRTDYDPRRNDRLPRRHSVLEQHANRSRRWKFAVARDHLSFQQSWKVLASTVLTQSSLSYSYQIRHGKVVCACLFNRQILVYQYPAGGLPTKVLHARDGRQPFAAVITPPSR